MTPETLPPSTEHDISVISALLGIESLGYPAQENLPTHIDLSALWRVIAPSESDHGRYPFEPEIFWGLDLSDGKLTVTEPTIGHGMGVTPKYDHLIGAHSHPRRKSRSPFVVDEVEVAPSEMAYFLDIHQYAELVFNRSPERTVYPCTLALKTQGTKGIRYGNHEAMQQELGLQSILLHEPFWRRERVFHDRCDSFAQEKRITLYRGNIEPGADRQPFLTLVG